MDVFLGRNFVSSPRTLKPKKPLKNPKKTLKNLKNLKPKKILKNQGFFPALTGWSQISSNDNRQKLSRQASTLPEDGQI